MIASKYESFIQYGSNADIITVYVISSSVGDDIARTAVVEQVSVDIHTV